MQRVIIQSLLFTIFSIVLLLLNPQNVLASVVINEFYSDGSDDWVELYNDSQSPVDISNYRLRDSSASNKIDLNGILAANGYISVDWNNRLGNDGDVIKLVLATDENTIVDQVGYGTEGKTISAPNTTQSAGRSPDGSSSWKIFSMITKGSSNNAATIVPTATLTPTPTLTPTVTPKPTNSPTPTSTPKPTSTPTTMPNTPTPTLKPIVYASSKLKLGELSTTGVEPTAVLGASTKAEEKEASTDVTPVPSPMDITNTHEGAQTPMQKIFLGGMGILALVTLGLGLYIYKQSRNQL